mmetsp:Transcript_6385/g.15433  ORF Transcript_6385/g.15433 Transcript_6385/m.15433 type:complete len:201 (-) Transcript_6385:489-1091(-)
MCGRGNWPCSFSNCAPIARRHCLEYRRGLPELGARIGRQLLFLCEWRGEDGGEGRGVGVDVDVDVDIDVEVIDVLDSDGERSKKVRRRRVLVMWATPSSPTSVPASERTDRNGNRATNPLAPTSVTEVCDASRRVRRVSPSTRAPSIPLNSPRKLEQPDSTSSSRRFQAAENAATPASERAVLERSRVRRHFRFASAPAL